MTRFLLPLILLAAATTQAQEPPSADGPEIILDQGIGVAVDVPAMPAPAGILRKKSRLQKDAPSCMMNPMLLKKDDCSSISIAPAT